MVSNFSAGAKKIGLPDEGEAGSLNLARRYCGWLEEMEAQARAN
jgi:hypothetical protein